MKKNKKKTKGWVQIAPCRQNPEKRLKDLNLDTDPKSTFTLFRPYMGGIMYLSSNKKKGVNDGKDNQ